MKILSTPILKILVWGARVIVFLFFFVWVGVAAEKIDINTAPLEDLVQIVHIGEKRAKELISLRPFSSLDDLARIKGIDKKRIEDIKKQGLAWVSTVEPQVESPETKPQSDFQKEEVKIIYPSGIVINEMLANPPPGIRDEEGEYIELFNQNSFEVDLTNWKIEDTAGRTITYIFPEKTKIGPRGFLVLYRPTTKITLNNDGDGLNLIQPDGKIVDSVSYEKSPAGQSYNRAPSGWVWAAILTPGSVNVITSQETKKTELVEETGKIDINTASAKELQKITGVEETLAQRIISARPFYSLDDLAKVRGIGPKILEEIKKQGLAWIDPELEPAEIEKTEPAEKGLAAVAEPLKQGVSNREIPKSLSLFLIALAIAIFSGTIILILKRKIKRT